MSELPSRTPYFDNAALQLLRENVASFQASREGVQMIGRNIFHVLGTDLVSRFTVENPVKQGAQRGPLDIIHNYTRPTMILAAGLGWEESTPAFRLLSTKIFSSAANTLKRRLGVQDEYEELSEEVESRTKLYIDNIGISDQDQQRVELFMQYFDLPSRSKHKLFIFLDAGKINTFWRMLQAKVARQEQEKETARVPLPRIRRVKIGDGPVMQQGNREELQIWLQRKNH